MTPGGNIADILGNFFVNSAIEAGFIPPLTIEFGSKFVHGERLLNLSPGTSNTKALTDFLLDTSAPVRGILSHAEGIVGVRAVWDRKLPRIRVDKG